MVAVTGASGTIGRTVVAGLAQAGHRVRALDRRTPDDRLEGCESFRTTDVCDYPALLEAVDGCCAVVHLAGMSSPREHDGPTVHNTNVVASYNALTAAAAAGIDTVCLASSINALGGAFSRRARYDYFPVDEGHPTYNEDPYSLSKWIVEHQADSVARRHPHMTIASLRMHGATPDRETAAAHARTMDPTVLINHLWGYTRLDACARACALVLEASWRGHETFHLVAPDTVVDTDSLELARRHWPDVAIRTTLTGNSGFYDCSKARRLLGWVHDDR